MTKNKSEEAMDQDFTSVTINQALTSADGESSFSLLYPPSNPGKAQVMSEATGRRLYFDIDQARQSDPDALDRINQEYDKRYILQTPDGQNVGVRIVNPESTEYSIGVMTSWSTDAAWDNERGIIQALALTYPDAKIVFIETPGMGDSDKLTSARRKEMISSGSFIPMAEQIAPALTAADIRFDLFVGISEGARAVISLAEKLKTPTVVTIDPPGTEHNSILKFFKGFALDEGNAQKAVLKATPDTLMADAHKELDSKRLAKTGLSALNKGLLSRARAMAKAGLTYDIQSACASGVKIYDYRCEVSAIATASVAENLARKTPGYATIKLPNAPHAIVEANPFAVSQLVVQALSLQNAQISSEQNEAARAAKRILTD